MLGKTSSSTSSPSWEALSEWMSKFGHSWLRCWCEIWPTWNGQRELLSIAWVRAVRAVRAVQQVQQASPWPRSVWNHVLLPESSGAVHFNLSLRIKDLVKLDRFNEQVLLAKERTLLELTFAKVPLMQLTNAFIDKSLQILLSTGWVPGLLVSTILFCYRLLQLHTAREGSVNNPKQAVKHPWTTREPPVNHPWTTRESPVNHPWYIREPFVRRVC